ncbi:MAG: DUF4364 family protein [Oscillospiraceae bacterium]|jgi:hypothetical protein|nr:DUF4364 family protein [Oscillospiraceae bacterium]
MGLRDTYAIKLLLLYILNRLSYPCALEPLAEAAQIDDGFTYFDVVQALSELIASGHAAESKPGEVICYSATEKGKAHGEIMESDLPYALKRKAGVTLMELAKNLEIENLVRNVKASNETEET